MWSKLYAATMLSLILCGCAATNKVDRGIGELGKPNYAVVKVYFATDRSAGNSDNSSVAFTSDRGKLTHGIVNVSIPRDHRMGEIESPSILKLEFREDPEKHIVVLETSVMQKNDFFGKINAATSGPDASSALIYIHGYNVAFSDAARRTAQMTYDLGFRGVPMFYSWPSNGALVKYLSDEDNATWAQANLEQFLLEFAEHSSVQNIYVVAHSMGARVFTKALANLSTKSPELFKRVKEVVLAAPDIDADTFKTQIAPAILAHNNPVTLYANSNDKALKASRIVHSNSRAGESGPALVRIAGIDSIDCSNVETDFLSHSYYADNKTLLSDLFYLINHRLRPSDRSTLRKVPDSTGHYWRFLK